MSVSDPRYSEAVIAAFGQCCLYCRTELRSDVVPVVEHLNGMNRFSVGLHMPGNVAIACKTCNNKKRNDDQKLLLAENGWESFLSHDGTRCLSSCKTCAYWEHIWPDSVMRSKSLASERERVLRFQEPYHQFIQWSSNARGLLRQKIETLYRDCQRFATDEIGKLATEVDLEFEVTKAAPK